jgi:hypothetical protein
MISQTTAVTSLNLKSIPERWGEPGFRGPPRLGGPRRRAPGQGLSGLAPTARDGIGAEQVPEQSS